jgi:hypothetical protein
VLKSAIKRISGPPASSSTETVRKWLVKFGSTHDKEISDLMIACWCEALADLPTELLEEAFLRTMRSCSFFPKPVDVRSHISGTDTKGARVEEEQAWGLLLGHVREYEWGDGPGGFTPGAPSLPAVVAHAFRAAVPGGPQALMGMLGRAAAGHTTDLDFAKKRFIEDLRNVRELGLDQRLLTRGEALRLLQELKEARPAVRALPAPGVAESTETSGAGRRPSGAGSGLEA